MTALRATLDGHALQLSETNSGGFVAVCECGWSGAVHETHLTLTRAGGDWVRDVPKACGEALKEHSRHCRDVRARGLGMTPDRARAIVSKAGRYSHR